MDRYVVRRDDEIDGQPSYVAHATMTTDGRIVKAEYTQDVREAMVLSLAEAALFPEVYGRPYHI